jgi:hypothetical protein
MRYLRNLGLILIAAVVPASAGAAPPAVCAPPAGFVDKPYPAIAPAEQLVSHTEQVVIDRAYPAVSEAMNKPLNQVIRQWSSLPGVFADYMLTPGEFGAPGSRHIVCLTDGTSVEEQALERDGTASSGRFRYIVWNYATPKARPIGYGVGEFRTVQIDGAHTRITWTYSFKLKDDVFPGYLGALGRWLFRVGFLDRDYAAMMRGVLNGYKTTAEAQPNDAQPRQ